MMPMSMDNPALDKHGNLKDASDMKWYHSKDDEQPLLMPKERVAITSGLSSKCVLLFSLMQFFVVLGDNQNF